MIANLGPSNIVWKHGTYILHHKIQHSWFTQVRELTFQYSLPDPLVTLTSPPASKPAWKAVVRRAVTTFWHSRLVAETEALPSLQFPPPVDHLWLLRHRRSCSYCPSADAKRPL